MVTCPGQRAVVGASAATVAAICRHESLRALTRGVDPVTTDRKVVDWVFGPDTWVGLGPNCSGSKMKSGVWQIQCNNMSRLYLDASAQVIRSHLQLACRYLGPHHRFVHCP